MIPFASQRGGGQDLATHLLNDYDNDLAEVVQVRGAIARDLHGAFKEWEVQADALTRCRKYLYSMSINPDPEQGSLTREQYIDYIRRAEESLGLADQPRAVVFHVKHGREHCHVVWSRIDADQQKAVHLAFDHDKLMRVTREFARDHHLQLPDGYSKSRGVGQISLYEQEQHRQTGLSKDDHMRQVTEAWRHSDDARAFVQALGERGYLLATGKRPYVLVDLYGGMHALAKLIDDKTVRTKDLRTFLEKEYPTDALPSVEDAQQLAADHRKLMERTAQDSHYADALAQLKHAQAHRRDGVEHERRTLADRHRAVRTATQARQRAERDRLRTDLRTHLLAVREERRRHQPTGLAAFLGRITGITLLQKKVHRYRDRQEIRAYFEQRGQLRTRQKAERKALELRLSIPRRDIERRAAALERIERRELAAFERDNKREANKRARGQSDAMPPFRDKAPTPERQAVPDVLAAFERARHPPRGVPDLMAAFERAAREKEDGDNNSGSGSGMDQAKPPEPPNPDRRPHKRDRER